MPLATIGNIDLYYEISGPDHGEPLLLIQGLGTQMIAWPEQFIDELHDAGLRTILFDNRDVGLSSKLDDAPDYTLADMSNDAAQLIRHLGFEHAHVAGASMGGMIAQQLVIDHPDVVHSLTIIFSIPSRDYIVDDPDVWELRHHYPTTRDEAIAHFIEVEQISGLEGIDPDSYAEFAARVYDRCYCPDGTRRQETATRAAPPRLDALRSVTAPTCVIHGRNDRLLDYQGGIAIALAIPNAELHVYEGMGHQLVPRLIPDYVAAIARTAERARAVHVLQVID